MENPNHKWKFLAGKIIYFNGSSKNHGYVSHNQRVVGYDVVIFTGKYQSFFVVIFVEFRI